MKKTALLCVILTATAALAADDSTEALRKEFEAYKQASNERIQALEKQIAETPGDTSLTETELNKIRSTLARATLDFEFHGYLRAGYGVDDSGKAMSTFKAPTAEAKYRLGNEAETYLETTFLTRAAPEDSGDATFETKITLAYVNDLSNSDAYDPTTSLREAYATALGVLPNSPTISFWAGQRFYSRYDVHMNDFYYRDMSGYGGGIEGIPLGDSAKLAVAWIGGSVDQLQSDGSAFVNPDATFNKNSLDIAITGAEVPGGTIDVLMTLAYFNGNTAVGPGPQAFTVDDGAGAAISVFHKSKINDAVGNILGFQYGQGAAYNFKSQISPPTGLNIAPIGITSIDMDDLMIARVFDNVFYDINESWSLQGLALYQQSDIGTQNNSEVRWASLGVRPTYHYNRYFSLATEAGLDYSDPEGGEDGSVFKLTLAPQITPQSTVFSRPALRAFFTYAWWDSDLQGQVGNPSYPSSSQGLSAGMQLETWW